MMVAATLKTPDARGQDTRRVKLDLMGSTAASPSQFGCRCVIITWQSPRRRDLGIGGVPRATGKMKLAVALSASFADRRGMVGFDGQDGGQMGPNSAPRPGHTHRAQKNVWAHAAAPDMSRPKTHADPEPCREKP